MCQGFADTLKQLFRPVDNSSYRETGLENAPWTTGPVLASLAQRSLALSVQMSLLVPQSEPLPLCVIDVLASPFLSQSVKGSLKPRSPGFSAHLWPRTPRRGKAESHMGSPCSRSFPEHWPASGICCVPGSLPAHSCLSRILSVCIVLILTTSLSRYRLCLQCF